MSSPLPTLQNDPSVVQGNQIKAQYAAECQAVRADSSASDIGKGQRLEQVWNAANNALTVAYRDLIGRYEARREALLADIPLGPPPVPDGTSVADAALMAQLFRSALAEARNAEASTLIVGGSNISPIVTQPGTLAAMLSDAETYGDDLQRRAVLSAAWEQGNIDLVRSWTDLNGLSGLLDEVATVQEVLSGQGFANMWILPALSKIPEPQESVDLPARIAAAEAVQRASYQPGGANYRAGIRPTR